MLNKASKIESVQLLRALAVTLVVYAHTIDKNPVSFQTAPYYLENWGAIGLDLFFVISGFIMTIVTPRYIISKDWKDFAVKRIIRIIPLYWSLSALLTGYLILTHKYLDIYIIFKTIFFFPIIESKFIPPVISVGWSLSLEIYFYLLISIFLIKAGPSIYKYLVSALFVISIIGYFLNPSNALLKFLTNPLLAEFAFGIIAGRIYTKVSSLEIKNTSALKLLAVSLTVVGAVWMIATIFTGYFGASEADLVLNDNKFAMIRTLIWGIPCFLFLTGFVLMEYAFGMTIPPFLITLGDASYSCYLIHGIILMPIAIKLFRLFKIQNGDLFILFTIIFILICSVLFYKYVEKNLTRLVIRFVDRKNNKAVQSATV